MARFRRRNEVEEPEVSAEAEPKPIEWVWPELKVRRIETEDGVVYVELPAEEPRTTPAPRTRGGLRDPDRSNQSLEPPWQTDLFGRQF